MNIFKLCFRIFVITLCCVAMGNWTSCLLWQCFLITLSVTVICTTSQILSLQIPPAPSPVHTSRYLYWIPICTFCLCFYFLMFWFTFCRCTVFTAQNECDFFLIKEIYITWRTRSALVCWQFWFCWVLCVTLHNLPILWTITTTERVSSNSYIVMSR